MRRRQWVQLDFGRGVLPANLISAARINLDIIELRYPRAPSRIIVFPGRGRRVWPGRRLCLASRKFDVGFDYCTLVYSVRI